MLSLEQDAIDHPAIRRRNLYFYYTCKPSKTSDVLMKLLIINPNINSATNERIRAIAEPMISAPDELEVVSADSAIELIETVKQSELTIPGVLAIVKARHTEVGAIIIAAFSDPGLKQAQRIASCTVVGISEAAMKKAANLAARFSIITLGSELGPAIKRSALSYGVANQLATVTVLPWTVSQVSAAPQSYRRAFVDACKTTIIKDGVGAIIIGGGPLSGIADSIADDVPVPVLDGVRCAVEMVLMSPRKNGLS